MNFTEVPEKINDRRITALPVDGVTSGVLDGVGVTVAVSVVVVVTDAVIDEVGVTLGVKLDVAVKLGVAEGVGDLETQLSWFGDDVPESHGAQLVEPDAEYVPSAQARQEDPLWNVPA